MTTVNVLFVCMGNICRSPTGEGVFKHHVERDGLAERVYIDSAGTIGYHAGNPADSRMRQAASKRGYRLDSIARQVLPEDIDSFDLIVANNVIHDTRNVRDTLRHVARLLAPGGLLLMLELTDPQIWWHMCFGSLEGWWRFKSDPTDHRQDPTGQTGQRNGSRAGAPDRDRTLSGQSGLTALQPYRRRTRTQAV